MAGSADILVACFDPAERKALLGLLRGQGCEPALFATVGEVRRMVAQQRAALIICEAQLEDGSFRDVLETVARAGAKTPVVVVSRTGDTAEYLEAMQSGAFDFLAYPFRPAEVEWIVSNALRRTLAAAV